KEVPSHLRVLLKFMPLGEEPFPYEEVHLEVVAQVEKFITLVGRKPAYLNGHAFRSPNFSKALKDVADEYGLICMDEIVDKYDLKNCGFKSSGKFAQGWYQMPFKNDTQLDTNAEQFFIDHFDELLVRDVSYVICHPGYVSMDLMECPTLNLVRMKDLQMCISPRVKELIEKNHVELISIKEFVEEYDK
ncbi:MAG: ChbG/HpnK family deacetylase, partial [Erysipelotrichaceae bacterium]|nr:ChbG/HpnK family deacetylase [Erysipelotrichaceae bacterium]